MSALRDDANVYIEQQISNVKEMADEADKWGETWLSDDPEYTGTSIKEHVADKVVAAWAALLDLACDVASKRLAEEIQSQYNECKKNPTETGTGVDNDQYLRWTDPLRDRLRILRARYVREGTGAPKTSGQTETRRREEKTHRQRFSEFVAKFRAYYRSVEVRAICGRFGHQWRNIWTLVRLLPQTVAEFCAGSGLPGTEAISCRHTSLEVDGLESLLDGIQDGLLKVGDCEILYLPDSPDETRTGLRLEYYYREGPEDAEARLGPWACAVLRGRGPRPSNRYLDVEGYDLDLHLRAQKEYYDGLDALTSSFGYHSGRFDNSGVLIHAPVLMALGHCVWEKQKLSVTVNAAPSLVTAASRSRVIWPSRASIS